ncbi:hypothetical protein M2352_004910 [Azospirillum fermentarium]|nr:hypothetical protein [Azospirillum fermentarium]MCW2249250.1 hypothetical protein [Azospirillum fermentarium]
MPSRSLASFRLAASSIAFARHANADTLSAAIFSGSTQAIMGTSGSKRLPVTTNEETGWLMVASRGGSKVTSILSSGRKP